LLQQAASKQAAELCSWASWQHLPFVCTNGTCVHFAKALSRISSKCCPESQCLWNPEHKHSKSCLFREREREREREVDEFVCVYLWMIGVWFLGCSILGLLARVWERWLWIW
jgi:hypothetical protein